MIMTVCQQGACHNAAVGLELVIRGATVVTPGHREAADIGIADGRIAQLGGTMAGTQELDAGGLLAIPGGVDAHTHLVHQGLGGRLGFPTWVDDFWSGSRAAITGGITTIGNMTCPVPDDDGTEETPSAAINREMAGAAPEAAVDWFLHPILLHPATLPEGEVAALAEGGHASIKIFLSDPDLAADEPALLAAASAAKAAGSVTLLHCEDGAMLREAGQKLIAEGRGAVANFPDARPVAAEVAAVEQAIGIARRTGAPVYIVHLSSAAALDRCRRARAAGLPVYVEARPLYLHLTRERFAEPDAAKYTGAPPLREASDRDALWAGLAAGDIDTLCSDHAPWTLDAKLDPALNAVTARQGVADLETLMPMLYSEGVLAGRISLDQFVALTSANAARIFGLYPRKGAIAVGSDADIALWDPRYRRTIDGTRMQSLSGYSVYDGWQVQGWPKFVIRRGQLVLADGQLTARPGDGEWLRRTPMARTLPSRPMRPLPSGFTQAHNYANTAGGQSCAQSQLRPRSLLPWRAARPRRCPVTSAALSHRLAPAGRANGARIRHSSDVAARALAVSCGYRHSPAKGASRWTPTWSPRHSRWSEPGPSPRSAGLKSGLARWPGLGHRGGAGLSGRSARWPPAAGTSRTRTA